MRLTIIALVTSSFIFSIDLTVDTLRQRNIQAIPYSELPKLSSLSRNPNDLVGRWKVLSDYYSPYFEVSSDSAQTVPSLGQFHGYILHGSGVNIQTPMDTAVLNYSYVDSGAIDLLLVNAWVGTFSEVPGKTLAMSNTPITQEDRMVNPFLSQTDIYYNNSEYTSIILDAYKGDIYPRYLYTTTITRFSGFGSSVAVPMHFLHIWRNENTVEFYLGGFSLDDTTAVLFSDNVDYQQKSAHFDSVIVFIPENFSFDILADSIEFMIDGYLEPDSILIPVDSVVHALDYHKQAPTMLNDPYADYVTWVFYEDHTGNHITTNIDIDWPYDEISAIRDSIPLTWEIIEDSVLIVLEQEDSLFVSYGLMSDTLYLDGDFTFCDQGLCSDVISANNPLDTLNSDWFKNLTGLFSINNARMNYGLEMETIISDAQIILSPNNQLTISTYSVGTSSHSLEFFNVGLDSLSWFFDEPSESWIILDTLSGLLAPNSMQNLTFTINGDFLASGTEHSIDLIIYSNDNDDSTTVIPLSIQVNPPDLYMVGLNNNSFTIDEDDSLETSFYIIGPEGNTTFSISGDTNTISGYVIIDESYIPNTVSNYSLRAILHLVPDHNWYGEANVYVTADNEYDYSNTDTLSLIVNSVYDQIVEPQMVFPQNGHTFYFETMTDPITFIWTTADYPDFEAGPGFEYRLRIVQSNETSNIVYHYTDLTDTTFTFFSDSSTYSGQNNNYIWSLYTTEANLPEVLDGQSGAFFVVLPAMEITSNNIPNSFMLYNAYPNPFNPMTMIKYDIPELTFVSVNIYDMVGRHVRTMINKRISAGRKSIIWNGTNSFGQPISAGTYFYTIKTDRYFETKKIILLK